MSSSSGVAMNRNSRVVVSSSVPSMLPSSSWYLRRRCVSLRDVSCSILCQCCLKCWGRRVRLRFVICRCVGALFCLRWCVIRSAWAVCDMRSDVGVWGF